MNKPQLGSSSPNQDRNRKNTMKQKVSSCFVIFAIVYNSYNCASNHHVVSRGSSLQVPSGYPEWGIHQHTSPSCGPLEASLGSRVYDTGAPWTLRPPLLVQLCQVQSRQNLLLLQSFLQVCSLHGLAAHLSSSGFSNSPKLTDVPTILFFIPRFSASFVSWIVSLHPRGKMQRTLSYRRPRAKWEGPELGLPGYR